MSLLDRILGRRPGRDAWPRITSAISCDLEEQRKLFHDTAIHRLRRAAEREAQRRPEHGPPWRIRSDKLEGKAVHALKAFQLWNLEGFLVEHRYLPSEDVGDFIDSLEKTVCLRDAGACGVLILRYRDVEDEGGALIARFLNDIGGHITGEEGAMLLVQSEVLLPILGLLGASTHLALAMAFKDNATVERMMAVIRLESENHAGS